MSEPESFVFKLREAAKNCSNAQFRILLRADADEFAARCGDFYVDPTEKNLGLLIGCWAKGKRTLREMPPEGTPAPVSGAPAATVFATERLAA